MMLETCLHRLQNDFAFHSYALKAVIALFKTCQMFLCTVHTLFLKYRFQEMCNFALYYKNAMLGLKYLNVKSRFSFYE